MGGAKRLAMELEERGFGEVDGELCLDHLIVPYLRSHVPVATVGDSCRLCGLTDRPRGLIEDVAAIVVDAIRYWYADPIEGLYWDGREGGYQGILKGTPDVVDELCVGAFDPAVNDVLCSLLISAIEVEASTPWGAGSDLDPLEFAWQVYADDVARESRFVFPPSPRTGYGAPTRVARFLEQVLIYVSADMDLLKRVEGLQVFRGRLVEDPTQFIASASELGPAPGNLAAANRMSAPGISLLYASEDAQTAIAEIAGHGVAPYAVVGRFDSLRQLFILDFTADPAPAGSPLDPAARTALRMSAFLSSFVEHVTRSVIPDGRQHVEYAPTQVLTEYLRWMSPHPIDGIALPSAQTGGKTYVIFCDRNGVADSATDRPGVMFRLAHDETVVYEVRRRYEGSATNLRPARREGETKGKRAAN